MRARNIKPGFYKNADLAECSMAARLLAPGLWLLADREGRLEDRPKQIKGEVFPYDNLDVEILLGELSNAKHITRYEVGGQRFIQIEKFSDHQRPHTNESISKIPAPKQIRKPSLKLPTKEESHSDQGSNDFALNDDTLTTDPGYLNEEPSPNGDSACVEKITLESLCTDHNAEWLAKKRSEGRYIYHDEHFVLEQFQQYCRSKGVKYKDYVDAYRNAFEWDKCKPKHADSKPNKDDRARAAVLRGLGVG